MLKKLQLLLIRNYWLVLAAVVTLGFLSLSMSPTVVSKRPRYRPFDELYKNINNELNFEVVTPEIPSPHKHVAFLKVHKSGSTTAQNLLLRFGWNNNLTFVLPPAKNAFRYPNIISLRESLHANNTLPPPKGKHYELLCNHVVYNRTAFRKFMPNDTFYIGIVREPYEMFKSTLNYLRPGYIYNKIKTRIPASDYLKDPAKYEPANPTFSFTNNRMAVEFGCPNELIAKYDKEKLVEFLRNVTDDFGLVIVSEMFDESVVLMRRLLNWSVKDVLYIDKNIAHHKNESALVGPFDRQMYKKWAKIDYALYDHFFRRLREQIREEGYDFDDELLYFQEVKRMATEFCRGSRNTNTPTKLRVQESKWSDKFELTKFDCDQLQRQEMPFVQDVRMKQYGSRDI